MWTEINFWWLRLPTILICAIYALLLWAYPSQLEDLLQRALSEAPLRLGMAVLTTLSVLALLHLLFVAHRSRLTWWVDLPLAAGPFILFGLCIVRSAEGTAAQVAIGGITAACVLGVAFGGKLLHPRHGALLPAVLAGCAIVFVAAVVGTLMQPVDFPREIGAIAIVTGAFTLILALTLSLVLLRWWGFGVAAVMIAALLFDGSTHDISRNAETAPVRAGGIEDAFMAWLKNRPDLDAYRQAKRPYPMILASAEGGGLYAAAHAFTALHGMQTLCPMFAQHLFAIAGVSGGSVGMALFNENLDDTLHDQIVPCSRPNTSLSGLEPLTKDNLSPVLAALLFVELPSALIPGLPFGHDRASALELGLKSSTLDATKFFSQDYSTWSPRGASPALLFVSTDVRSGTRVIFAPFGASKSLAKWADAPGVDIASAAVSSARFPWVTPAGRVALGSSETVLLVDGGYFEDSGADTAMDVIRAIKDFAAWGQCPDQDCSLPREPDDCRLVVTTLATEEMEWNGCDLPVFLSYLAIRGSDARYDASEPEVPTPSFLLDPLTAMLSTRSARGREAVQRARGEFCITEVECLEGITVDQGFFEHWIPVALQKLPLGWAMSPRHVEYISDLALTPDDCHVLAGEESFDQTGEDATLDEEGSLENALSWARYENGCNAAMIAWLFNPNQNEDYYGIFGYP